MLYFERESYLLNGAAMRVYNELGAGFLESVYQEAMEWEMQKLGIPYEKEKLLKILYDGHIMQQTFRADFVCFRNIIVELKAVSSLDATHVSQLYNYLKATQFKLGLMYNFGNAKHLERERKVL